jgi:hypothetical protein
MNNGILAALWMIAVPTFIFSIAAIVREFPIPSLIFFLTISGAATLYNVWKQIKNSLDEDTKQSS